MTEKLAAADQTLVRLNVRFPKFPFTKPDRQQTAKLLSVVPHRSSNQFREKAMVNFRVACRLPCFYAEIGAR